MDLYKKDFLKKIIYKEKVKKFTLMVKSKKASIKIMNYVGKLKLFMQMAI